MSSTGALLQGAILCLRISAYCTERSSALSRCAFSLVIFCPVVGLESRLPNGSLDGGCKEPPGPGLKSFKPIECWTPFLAQVQYLRLCFFDRHFVRQSESSTSTIQKSVVELTRLFLNCQRHNFKSVTSLEFCDPAIPDKLKGRRPSGEISE